jgi:hypothetical protein
MQYFDAHRRPDPKGPPPGRQTLASPARTRSAGTPIRSRSVANRSPVISKPSRRIAKAQGGPRARRPPGRSPTGQGWARSRRHRRRTPGGAATVDDGSPRQRPHGWRQSRTAVLGACTGRLARCPASLDTPPGDLEVRDSSHAAGPNAGQATGGHDDHGVAQQCRYSRMAALVADAYRDVGANAVDTQVAFDPASIQGRRDAAPVIHPPASRTRWRGSRATT